MPTKISATPQEGIRGMESAEDRAYALILKEILFRTYRPGDAILETVLAERYGLSRTPVRNALSRLMAEGVLERRKMKGCFIPYPTAEDRRHAYGARRTVEVEIGRLAARCATEEDVAGLLQMHDREEREVYRTYTRDCYFDFNMRFHMEIARIGRNPYLTKFFHSAFLRTQIYGFFFDDFIYGVHFQDLDRNRDPEERRSFQQHTRIVRAVAAGDEDEAARAMAEHVEEGFEGKLYYLHMLSEAEEGR